MEETGHQAKKRVDLSDEEIEEKVLRIKQTIQQGRFGCDYTLTHGIKMKRLKENYFIEDSRILEILKDLDLINFIKAEYSDNEKFPDDIMYIFKKHVSLMPKLIENAEMQIVCIYIKITWTQPSEIMLVMSFHEDE
ncbi:MAG: hypothetical protein PHX08_24000 [Lachnospiraceae bacterium]|nr:hypothetical protein [Lachnospiraceae bacterium]